MQRFYGKMGEREKPTVILEKIFSPKQTISRCLDMDMNSNRPSDKYTICTSSLVS